MILKHVIIEHLKFRDFWKEGKYHRSSTAIGLFRKEPPVGAGLEKWSPIYSETTMDVAPQFVNGRNRTKPRFQPASDCILIVTFLETKMTLLLLCGPWRAPALGDFRPHHREGNTASYWRNTIDSLKPCWALGLHMAGCTFKCIFCLPYPPQTICFCLHSWWTKGDISVLLPITFSLKENIRKKLIYSNLNVRIPHPEMVAF